MKNYLLIFTIVAFFVACKKDLPESENMQAIAEEEPTVLPYQVISLNDLRAFKATTENWKIVSNASIFRNKEKAIKGDMGSGVLINIPDEKAHEHIFFDFEHGDMELEMDVMMPVKSNSGLYFQGRYEVQLFDSWGIENPKYSDMGGIYQRWDKTKDKGNEGFEGQAPLVNAAKAPGLWQHFKIIFHAPKFDLSGNKIQNAYFEEVWLNGVLIQKNIEVTGPTRAAAFPDEKPLGPFMIQGDHGPVAIKDIKYKLYNDHKIEIKNTSLNIYDNSIKMRIVKNIDSMTPINTIKADSISPLMSIDKNAQNILVYNGTFTIPKSGDYLFDMTVNGGAALLIKNDTIINLNGDYDMNTTLFGKTTLQEGEVPYTLIYNKPVPWKKGFDLYVEGPNIQRYSILKTSSLMISKKNPLQPIRVEALDRPVTQRSFLMFKGNKRTHCISVGMPEGISYSLDLSRGSLLHFWSGDFLNTTQMWHARGEHQLGEPEGFVVSSHGNPEFTFLKDNKAVWPDTIPTNTKYKNVSYEFNDDGIPKFTYKIDNAMITITIIVSKDKRKINRVVTIETDKNMWHKVADGESIEQLEDGAYVINDESYYVEFPKKEKLQPFIRKINNKDELLIKVPSGKNTITYSIIW